MFFAAVHTWKAKDFVTVGKKVLGALANLPKGIALCSSYVHNTGGWCIYSAESQEGGKQIKTFLNTAVPEMTTDVTPVLQFFPPSPDIYPLIANLIAATSK